MTIFRYSGYRCYYSSIMHVIRCPILRLIAKYEGMTRESIDRYFDVDVTVLSAIDECTGLSSKNKQFCSPIVPFILRIKNTIHYKNNCLTVKFLNFLITEL